MTVTPSAVLCRVVAPSGAWAYLDAVGHVSGLSYSWNYSGGPSSAQLSLDAPPGAHVPALGTGATLTVHRGTGKVWAGRVSDVDRDSPWKIQVDGLAGLANREPVGVTGTLDAIVDDAISAGLPWTRPATLGTDTWQGGDAGGDVGSTTLNDVLTTVLAQAGKRWTLDVTGALTAVSDPTTPTLIVRADTVPPATLNDYATRITARYRASSTGNYGTVRVTNSSAEAKFGRVNRSIDLGYSVMTSTQATSYAQAYLDRVSPRMTVSGDFTVSPGQVTTGSGAPVDLPGLRPGALARIQLVGLVRDTLLVPTTAIDMLIGQTDYDADAGTCTLSPESKTLDPILTMFAGRLRGASLMEAA